MLELDFKKCHFVADCAPPLHLSSQISTQESIYFRVRIVQPSLRRLSNGLTVSKYFVMRRSYGSIEFIFVFIYLFTVEKVQPFI